MINILIKNFNDILKNINFNYEIVNFDSKNVDIILNCYNVHLDFNILKQIENKIEIMSYLKNVYDEPNTTYILHIKHSFH